MSEHQFEVCILKIKVNQMLPRVVMPHILRVGDLNNPRLADRS